MKYTSSLSSPLTQLADVITYVIRRRVEGGMRFDSMFTKLMDKMWRGGEWHGWKKFSVEAK